MRKIICLLALISWILFISILSLVQLNVSAMPKVSMADKMVHFTFHFILAGLLFINILLHYPKKVLNKIIIYSALISFFYGIAIEISQHIFTRNRHADVNDILANSIGCMISLSLLYLYHKKKHFEKL